jgi:hypothetical protein
MTIKAFTVSIDPDGWINVTIDDAESFEGMVDRVERFKATVSRLMWLTPETRLAINAEIDSKVARWQHCHDPVPSTPRPEKNNDLVHAAGGCLGQILWLWILMAWPLVAVAATVVWCWNS